MSTLSEKGFTTSWWMLLKINLGCGRKRIEDSLGVDVRLTSATDVLASAYKLPFKTRSVDVVIADQLLEHCRNPYIVLTEAYRVLKPNGYLDVSVPVPGAASSFDPTHVFIVDKKRWLTILTGFFWNIEWGCYGIRFKDVPEKYVERQKELISQGYSDFAEGLRFVCSEKRQSVKWRAIPWWLEDEIKQFTGKLVEMLEEEEQEKEEEQLVT